MKNKLLTNITTIITKIEAFDFKNKGKVSIINDRYILPSDEILPLGVIIHLYINRRNCSNRRTPKLVNGKYYSPNDTGQVSRAYLQIANEFIHIKIADNFKERTYLAKKALKNVMPNNLNEPLTKEFIYTKSIPIQICGVSSAFTAMNNEFNTDYQARRKVIKESADRRLKKLRQNKIKEKSRFLKRKVDPKYN